MSSLSSVTDWLAQLAGGDRDAVGKLWQRYYPALVRLARDRLRAAPALANDAEDVALAAFDSCCRGVEQGRFPALFDRDGVWQLLVTLTARKAANLVRDAARQKRGGGRMQTASSLADPGGEGELFAELVAREPDPQFAARAAEECRRLLAALDEPVLRDVAVWKMEGYTTAEIAGKLGRSLPTVERKLRLIRKLWEGEGPS